METKDMLTRSDALASVGFARKRKPAFGSRLLAGLALLAFSGCNSGGDVSLGTDQSDSTKGQECGDTRCGAGEVCCNDSCGICTKPGEGCILLACEPGGGGGSDPGDPGDPDDPPGQQCGDTVCGAGEECCNASCGTCVPAGGACDQRACEPGGPPSGELCGNNWCGEGTYCCNPTCGMCVAEGEGCIEPDCGRQLCDAQDAAGVGACEMVLGVRWTGGTCEVLSGCSCEGADCGGLFPSPEVCESAHLDCFQAN